MDGSTKCYLKYPVENVKLNLISSQDLSTNLQEVAGKVEHANWLSRRKAISNTQTVGNYPE